MKATKHLMQHKNDIFCYWTYRRMFTPYEEQNAFSDETQYESITGNLGKIVACSELSNGDILIEFEDYMQQDDGSYVPSEYGVHVFRRLSEIHLETVSQHAPDDDSTADAEAEELAAQANI